MDEKIAEAAIQVAVSKIVAASLEEEMAKLKKLLVAGSSIDELTMEKRALEAQLRDLKLQASEEERAMKAQMTEQELKLKKTYDYLRTLQKQDAGK